MTAFRTHAIDVRSWDAHYRTRYPVGREVGTYATEDLALARIYELVETYGAKAPLPKVDVAEAAAGGCVPKVFEHLDRRDGICTLAELVALVPPGVPFDRVTVEYAADLHISRIATTLEALRGMGRP